MTLVHLGGGTVPAPWLSDIGNFEGIFNIRLSNTLSVLPIVVNSDGTLRIRALSFVGTGLRIWSSTNLQNWTEAAVLQVATQSDGFWFGNAEWNFQPHHPVTFYKVDYWWVDLF